MSGQQATSYKLQEMASVLRGGSIGTWLHSPPSLAVRPAGVAGAQPMRGGLWGVSPHTLTLNTGRSSARAMRSPPAM
jgi:hypothetical protein